ncbi:MAG: hypothetical protein A2756_03300 [Candidatus Ryanbacteria bacterium RIFCSPHIGHO2_01_FULL_48_27]|uniref:Uncharacterized protein n=1 Tax=Candidatus Ryanbacteria bacterium RIFCSPHIGHO2_01_FULL_48_27 TaxID=1802115 RepID=A0A1G2G0E1_9BACT|nr:MAG: hypothetical protein A2756_03300 [Candidatus Ryanbacteria bacterium RIFCSPHIGHO2_01_FULL_48_27]
MIKSGAETFDAEAVLRDAFNDDEKSLEELRLLHKVDDLDTLRLVDDLRIDPTLDGLMLTQTLSKSLGVDVTHGEIFRTIMDGKLHFTAAEQKLYADFLSRDTFRDGDQQIVEDLFEEAGITRGDLKNAMTTIAAAQRQQESKNQ